uniref:Transferrin receptor 2 n=1 Tax=Poecilia latipinna TaxID=48699 RepID=A0A3B3UD20_9TELE
MAGKGREGGGVVYAHYGRPEDFNWLRSVGVLAAGHLVVMRVGGGVSFAEKVWLAERNGGGGALIYPDPADLPQDPRRLGLNVHLGSGDPFTPGFPSFNLSRFPPIPSSGPAPQVFSCYLSLLLSQVRCKPVTSDPDQYVILGAQRDSLGPGAVKSGVGTAILLELARTFSAMVKNGFSPRRSLLFVSWDAGDFGNVGATEWLEGYLSMLHLKAVAYFSLDQAIMGNSANQNAPCDDHLSASTSPLLVDLLDAAIRQVNRGNGSSDVRFSLKWLNLKTRVMMINGLGSNRFGFTVAYPFLNTPLDTVPRLQEVLGGRLGVTGRSLAELVGEMVLRLVHDHILPLRITSYDGWRTGSVHQVSLSRSLSSQSRGVSPQWLFSARGDYSRAAETLQRAIDYSDLHDPNTARFYNTRIMKVEYYFLSQYVSAMETPFRHVIHGRGNHTLSALTEHLTLLTSDPGRFDENRFRRQLALFTWTLQGAANALNGDVWSIRHTQLHTH